MYVYNVYSDSLFLDHLYLLFFILLLPPFYKSNKPLKAECCSDKIAVKGVFGIPLHIVPMGKKNAFSALLL